MLSVRERNTERSSIRVKMGKILIASGSASQLLQCVFRSFGFFYQRFDSSRFLGNRFETVVVNDSKLALR